PSPPADTINVTAWILGSHSASLRLPEDDESGRGRRQSQRQRLQDPSPSCSPKQLEPLGIRLLDQLDLPLPRPAFQRFFALDRVADVEMLLEPHEPLHPVA